MATAAAEVESIKDDFLTCSICKDTFTDPCTLNCQHSFCRQCLTDYIQSRPNCIQAKIIPCAFCLQSTPVVDPTQPVAEWAEQQKPSLMLKGLMDKFLKEREREDEVEGSELCFLCMKVGEESIASSWCCDCDVILCNRCALRHTKMSQLKDHIIKDLSEREAETNDNETLCPDHNEDITLVCRDCNNTLCQKCHKLNHSECSDVVTLGSLLPEIKSTMTGKRRILLAMVEKEFAVEKIASSNIQILRECEARSEKAVKKSIADAMCLLKQREVDLLRELRVDVNRKITKQKVFSNAVQSNIQMLKQQLKVIDQTLQARSDVEMYQRQSVWNEENDTLVFGQISENADRMTNERGGVSFEGDMENMSHVISEFGHFLNVDHRQSEWTDSYITVVNQETRTRTSFCVNDKNEKEECSFADLTVCSNRGSPMLVVTDSRHKKLKSVNLKDTNPSFTWNELKIEGKPLRIAKLSETRVISTLKERYLLIADVQKELSLVTAIKTEWQYCGLAVLADGRLAVEREGYDVYNNIIRSYIDIIKTDGTVIRTFRTEKYPFIDVPDYIAVSHDDNVIFCNRYSSLNCLTSTGERVFDGSGNKGLNSTCGITVTKTGEIIQAHMRRIALFTPDGKYKCDLLSEIHDMKNISGVCVNDKDLYVSTRNTTLVYTLK